MTTSTKQRPPPVPRFETLLQDIPCSGGPGASATVSVATVSTATAPLQLHEAACQARDSCDAATQADGAAAVGQAAIAPAAGVVDAGADLAPFLARAAPRMLEALSSSKAAARSSRWHSAAQQELSAELLYTLRVFDGRRQPKSAGGESKARQQLVVTGLAFNSTGNTLAAALGKHGIMGWCREPGALGVWNLARRAAGAALSSEPDRLLSVDCCLTAIAFHPTEPALLAGGTFNGEVVLWDLSQESAGGGDPQVAKSDSLGEARHREPVTAVVSR